MAYVKIAYDPDLSKIGDVVEVDDAEAAEMVNNGRGRIVRKPSAPTKKAAAKRQPRKRKAAATPEPGAGSPPADGDTSVVVPEAATEHLDALGDDS